MFRNILPRRLAGKNAHEIDMRVVRDCLVGVEPVPDDCNLLGRELREDGREETVRTFGYEDFAARL